MKRGWFIVLLLSLGMNAGVLYTLLSERTRSVPPPPRFFHPGRGPFHGEERFPPGRRPRPILKRMLEKRMGRMAERLDLDDVQRATLADLLDRMLPRIFDERERTESAREEIRALYELENVDPDAVREAVSRLNDAQSRLDSLVAETMLLEASILTPEQRKKYAGALPWGLPGGPGGPHPPKKSRPFRSDR